MAMERIRFKVEEDIVRMTIETLLRNGYSVTYNDTEEDVLTVVPCCPGPGGKPGHDTTKVSALLAAMQCEIKGETWWAVDDCWLRVRDANGVRKGWVRFVYGNDGWDVMNDYTTNLEDTLKDVNAFADSLS